MIFKSWGTIGKYTKREEETRHVVGIRIYVMEHPKCFGENNFFNGIYKLHEENNSWVLPKYVVRLKANVCKVVWDPQIQLTACMQITLKAVYDLVLM